MKKKLSVGKAILYGILIVYAVITIIPFLWALSSSFKTLEEIVSGSMNFIPKNSLLIIIKRFLSSRNYSRAGCLIVYSLQLVSYFVKYDF